MKLADKTKKITGILHLTAYDKNGVEVWQNREKNLIVASGYNIAAEALAGVDNARIAKVAIGTNGTEPQEGDAEITNSVIFNIQTVEYPQPGVVRFNFNIGYSEAVGVSVREFGLLTVDGRLFSRKVRETIEKTPYMSIVGAWEIHF